MNQQNKIHVGIHHGARELENNILLQSIPGLKDLHTNIEQFRNVAFNYNNLNKGNSFIKNGREKFNNNISILANRGMGKSSALLTVIREITNGRLFVKERYEKNTIDIINPMIDPEDIQSDILGWVIASLSERIEEIENLLKKSNHKMFILEESPESMLSKLKEKRNRLINCYSINREGYDHVALHRSINVNDYSKNLKEVLNYDYELHRAFEEFIDCLVEVKRKLNKTINELDTIDNEPLIYFFFDDLDMSSKKSIKILTDILSYFYHQNIVIFITGDYAVFEQSIKTFFLNETKDITLKMPEAEKKKEVMFADNRAEYFLKKVLPPSYRYYIHELSGNIQKSKIYYNSEYNNIFEKMNIFQLLSYIFYNGFNDINNDASLKIFFLPRIFNLNHKEISDIRIENDDYSTITNQFASTIRKEENVNYLYAYLSVFSVNTRGFMNAYNYICKEAKTIYQQNFFDSKNYWTSSKIQEFLQVLISSKHTYLKYKNKINDFISIKLDTFSENEANDNSYSKLRIDCEELQLFISDLVTKMKKASMDNKELNSNFIEEIDPEYIKEEIKSLIMLPILINELFYVIHKENYAQRYKSVQQKLKNILVNTFVNSLNEKIKILPANLGTRRTLCFFQQITSRMSIKSLQNINNTDNEIYMNSNNKKYIVQLYLATIELGNSGAKRNNEMNEVLFSSKYYEEYKTSTYTNLKDRNRKEKIISNSMGIIFKKLDREWLSNLRVFSNILEPSVISTENIVHQKFLKMCPNIPTSEFNEKLDNLYTMICRNDVGFNYYSEDKQYVLIQTYYYTIIKQLLKISENVTKNSRFTNINNIRNRIINIDKKMKMKYESEENISRVIYDEVLKRVKDNNEVNELNHLETSNLHLYAQKLIDLFDDLKMEFEFILNKLNTFYANNSNFYSLLETQIANYYDDYWILPRNRTEELLSEYSFRILSSGTERNKVHLRTVINSLVMRLDEMFIEEHSLNRTKASVENIRKNRENNRHFIVNELTESIFRMIRNQERRSFLINGDSLELQILDRVVNNYMDIYYLYSFILESCKIIENKDTHFFHTFKTGIEYGNK